MRGRVGDRARRERLVELVRAGSTPRAAAERVGLSRAWANRIIRREGLAAPVGRGRGRVTPEQVRVAYESAGSLAAAGLALDISAALVRTMLVEQGVALKPRTGPKPQARLEFDQLLSQGWGATRAALEVGVAPGTGRLWAARIRKADGQWVPDTREVVVGDDGIARYQQRVDDTPTRHLQLAERIQIADLRTAGLSLRAIAAEIGRSPSTVSREVRAHSDERGRYRPHAGDDLAAAGRARPKPCKLVDDGPLRAAVQHGLDLQWSPEQIAARLRRDYPDDESMRVAHETIYQAIYLQARGGLKTELQQALRTGRTRRKPRRRQDQRTKRFIEPMVMIADRPAEAADRAVPGHWEGDLITGESNKTAIATLVERSTRFVMLVHLPGAHDAESVRDGLIATMSTLPEHLRRSLTWDQGAEMALHHQVKFDAGLDVYFCNPASPWQRGSNENTNGLLRQYFPKSTDLSVHTPDDLAFVADRLNGRPRKTLDWDTPAQRMRDLLSTAA